MEVEDVCWRFGVARSTWARWLAQYGGLTADDAKRLKELEGETPRSGSDVAEAELDKAMLRERRRETSDPEPSPGCREDVPRTVGNLETTGLQVVGQNRATQRLDPPQSDYEEQCLRAWLRAFARHRSGGDGAAPPRVVPDRLDGEHKRARRMGRDGCLQVPTNRRTGRLTGVGTDLGVISPIVPNALWALALQFDVTIDGHQGRNSQRHRRLHRECLAIRVAQFVSTD